jgi:anti-sigma factor RsiW
MINDPVYKHFLELSWRRKLNLAEEEELRTFLEAHPEAAKEWETETGLNDALELMPDTEVPSNFNARVMQGIERARATERRHVGRQRIAWWRRFVPRIAFGTVLLVAGAISLEQFYTARVQAKARQAEVVRSFIAVSKVPSLPDPEILRDFDTIRLSARLSADEKLLTLLQ